MPEDTQDQTDQRDADQDESQHDTETGLGEKGAAALKEEREARRKAEKRIRDLEKADAERQEQDRKRSEAEQAEQGKFKELLEAREKELNELKSSLAERELNDLKRTIATDEGLPGDLAIRLVGTDEETLRKDAKALAKHLKARDTSDTDAGERTKPGHKKPDKSDLSNPARWGLRH